MSEFKGEPIYQILRGSYRCVAERLLGNVLPGKRPAQPRREMGTGATWTQASQGRRKRLFRKYPRSLGGFLDLDRQAHSFEFSDMRPNDLLVVAALEVVGSEFAIGCLAGKHVPDDAQDRMSNRDQRFL